MVTKKKKCKNCHKEQLIWKSGFCKGCYLKLNPTKTMKKSWNSLNSSGKGLKRKGKLKKVSVLGLEKRELKRVFMEELHNWEFKLWDKQEDERGYCYCFETGVHMHRSVYRENLFVYSHILPKAGKYKKFAMKEWNVKIVLPDYHTLYENCSEKAHKQLSLKLLYLDNIDKLDNWDGGK